MRRRSNESRIEITLRCYTSVRTYFPRIYEEVVKFETNKNRRIDIALDIMVNEVISILLVKDSKYKDIPAIVKEHYAFSGYKAGFNNRHHVIEMIKPVCYGEVVKSEEMIPISIEAAKAFNEFYCRRPFGNKVQILEGEDRPVKVVMKSLSVMFSGILNETT